MLRSLERLAEQRPILIAAGLHDRDEFLDFLEQVYGFDPAAPVVLLGDEQAYRAILEEISDEEAVLPTRPRMIRLGLL